MAKKNKKIAVKKNPAPKQKNVQVRGRKSKTGLGSVLADVGSWGGDTLAKIFGLGAYEVKQNSLLKSPNSVPVMHSSGESVRLCKREYICDVSSSTADITNTVYSVNPGLSTLFPFLANFASNFQQYKFLGLAFEFVSKSASALNSTNTALGYVALSFQYDSSDPQFTTKTALMNEMWAESGKPSENLLMFVECDPALRPVEVCNVRSTALPSASNANMFDWGNLTVATGGSQASCVIGELWATYDIALIKPTLSGGLSSSRGARWVSDTTAAYLLGDIPVTTVHESSPYITYAAGLITMFPPNGCREVQIYVNWYGGSATLADTTATKGNLVSTHRTHTPSGGNTAAAQVMFQTLTITDPNQPCSYILSGGTIPTSSAVEVSITFL